MERLRDIEAWKNDLRGLYNLGDRSLSPSGTTHRQLTRKVNFCCIAFDKVGQPVKGDYPMKTNKVVSIIALLALVFGALTPMPAQAKAAEPASSSKGISPEEILNSDGTLNLDGNFSGSLDLNGYSVAMDPVRGPVFGPKGSMEANAPAIGQWGALGGATNAFNNHVYGIAVSGTDIYVGGDFTDADGISAADYIAKWDGTQWSALGSNGAGEGALSYFVDTIAVSGSNVYVGGLFSVNDGETPLPNATNVAKWDGTHWSALGDNGGGLGALNGGVRALLLNGTDLYVGGDFTNAGGVPAADFIAKWDTVGTAWSALGHDSFGDGSLNAYVSALAMDGSGKLYAGGNFTNIAGPVFTNLAADYVAEWNGGGWSSLASNGGSNGSLNGEVISLAVSGANLYVGGAFTDVDNKSTILYPADYIAKWNGTDWSALGNNGSSNGSLNHAVKSVRVDASGNVYAGGNFVNVTNSDGIPINAADYVAKWDPAANSGAGGWAALGSDGNGGNAILNYGIILVNALAVSGSKVYVAGLFSVNNNGTPLSGKNFVSWDGTDWSTPTATLADGALIDSVYAIAVDGTNVYAGGYFTDVGNGATRLGAADYIAKWDGSHWSALGSNGHGDGSLNSTVYAITVKGTNVYVGGDFSDVNNNGVPVPAADYVANWNTLTDDWSALGGDGSGEGALNSTVYALQFSGSDLYAGGSFTNVTSNSHTWTSEDYIAKWNGTDWLPLLGDGNNNGSLNNSVKALAVSGTDLYVGGEFTDVNNGGTILNAADYLARWDGASWSALGNGSHGEGSLNNSVYAIAASGTNVYVGGYFDNVDNQGAVLNAADKIAKWDGTNWSALGHNSSGDGVFSTSNWEIDSIITNGNNVYVSGYFYDLEDNTTPLPAADYVAKWDGSHWSALGSDGAGDGAISNQVYALGISNTTLYVGGYFENAKSNGAVIPAADYIAAYGLSPITATISSTGTQDGWILESGKNTNVGGTMNSAATTFDLGDDAANRQYRGILSFSTKTLPDNAVITKMTLNVKKSKIFGGGNPITILGGIMADIKKGTFGTAALQITDFQTAASKSYGPFKPALVGGWYSINLSAGKAYINKLNTLSGLTQIRLRFKLNNNNNAIANYLALFSGNAPAASRPQLIIEYYLP
jgi:hypothetical protein